MHNLSSLLGKPILNINTAEELGHMAGIAMRDMAATHIVSTNGSHIATCDITGISDCIACVSTGTCCDNSPILPILGKNIVLGNGKSLGTIIDYQLTNTLRLHKVICDSCTFAAAKIGSFSADYLVIIPKKPRRAPNATHPVPSATSLPLTHGVISYTPVPSSAIPKVISDYSFLTGRIISRDIYLSGGKRLLCANSTINDNAINLAKVNNKLVELTLYSVKKS